MGDLKLFSDCLRPSNRDEVEDFGRMGSTASAKYSWFKAWVEVGRLLGSHIRHQVTNSLRAAGQCVGGKNRVHGVRRHLGEGEAQLVGQSRTFAPFTTANLSARLAVPVTGGCP